MRVTRLQVQDIAQEIRNPAISQWLFAYLSTHDGDEFDLDLYEPGELFG